MGDGSSAVLIPGAGGHGKAVLDLILAHDGWRAAGVVDAAPKASTLLGVPVLGDESVLPGLARSGIGLAHPAIGNNAQRVAAAGRLTAAGFALPALLHPSVIISHAASIADGVAVLARAVIGPDARIGRLALVNTGAIIEHDCIIEEAAHIAPGAVLAGGVLIGAGAMVGAGAVIRPGVIVGMGAIIGAGAAVLADVPAWSTVAGVPARPLHQEFAS